MKDLEKLCAEYLWYHPRLSIPEKVWGMCAQESQELMDFLKSEFISCHLLHCWKNRIERPRLYNPLSTLIPSGEWEHWVVCVTTGIPRVLDPTARQFDHTHPPIRIMTLGDLQREWLYYRKYKEEKEVREVNYK